MISQYDIKNYAQFNPLSMQEIWSAPQALRAQHDQLSEEFAQQEQAGGLSLLGLKEGVDDEAIKIHKTYMDETKKAADELATKGFIESGRRKNLYGLKQKYNNEVLPLENQLKIRQSRAEEWRKLAMDKTNIMSKNPNNISLVDMLKNPEAANYNMVSGAQMAKDVENTAKQYADRLFSGANVNKIKHLAAFQDLVNIQMGANPALVLNAMKNNPNTYKDPESKKIYDELVGIVNSTVEKYGLSGVTGDNQEDYNRGWELAASGLSAAIGKSSPQIIHDTWNEMLAKKKLDENPPEDKSMFGSEVSVIGEEGSVFQDEPVVSMNPLFNSNGAIQLYDSKTAPKPSGMYVTPTGGISKTAASPASKIDVENANRKQHEINRAINQYRKENNIPISGSGKQSQKQVFERMKYDNDFMRNYLSTTGHKITPIKDIPTSNSILNQAFYTNAGITTFAELGKNYSRDMESGIGLQEIAKRNGLSQDQITNYIQNSGLRAGLDRTSGLYTVQIPTKMKNIGTQNAPNWTADDGATYKTVGFSYSNSHKAPVYAINAIRQADNTNAKEPVPLTKGLKRDEATGLYQRRVYNPKDKKVYIAYYENMSGDNPVGYTPLTTTTKDGQQYHISGSDYRAMELRDIQDSEIINTEYKNVQNQSESLGKVNIN